MKIKNIKYGHTFEMTSKQYAEFIYARAYGHNGRVKFLNKYEDYIIVDKKNKNK